MAFRSEKDALEDESPLILNVALLLTDTRNYVNDEEIARNPPSLNSYIELAVERIVIENPLQGVNQFLPVIFTHKFPCQVNLSVHVLQVDLKYRFSQNGDSSDIT